MKIISLDADIAKEYGFPAACVFHSLCFYIELNKANGRNFHDGHTWCHNSVKAWRELFYWMSGAQVRSALDKLEKSGLIVSGNYNRVAYDRTKWYALTDLGEELSPSSRCDSSQIHLRNLTNGIAENSKPIPVSNTVTNKKTLSGSQANTDRLESEKDLAKQVIDRLNEKSGKSYRYSSSSINAILPRLREGFTVEDCIAVIDLKCKQWRGTEQEQYLRPSTLFRACNFEGYLQAAKSGSPSKPEEGERWKSARELEREKRVKALRKELSGKDLAILATEKPETVREAARLGVITPEQFKALKTALESAETAKAKREQAEKFETMLNLAKSNGLAFVEKYCHGVTAEEIEQLKKLL